MKKVYSSSSPTSIWDKKKCKQSKKPIKNENVILLSLVPASSSPDLETGYNWMNGYAWLVHTSYWIRPFMNYPFLKLRDQISKNTKVTPLTAVVPHFIPYSFFRYCQGKQIGNRLPNGTENCQAESIHEVIRRLDQRCLGSPFLHGLLTLCLQGCNCNENTQTSCSNGKGRDKTQTLNFQVSNALSFS